MNLLRFVERELRRQEMIAPSREDLTRNNHFVSQFIQKSWGTGKAKKVCALFKEDTSIKESVSASNLMAENYLYTIKELSNPNLFEKLRLEIESPLVAAIREFEANGCSISDEDSSSMIALLLCSSPLMVEQYSHHIRTYLRNADRSDDIEEWYVRGLACGLMMHQIYQTQKVLLEKFTFRVVRTSGSLVLSDYPVIQIFDKDLIMKEVGVYRESDQILLPVGVNHYLEATKRGSEEKSLGDLTAAVVNEFSFMTAEHVVIGDSRESLIAAAVHPAGTYMHVKIPAERQVIKTEFGLLAEIVILDDGSLEARPIYGHAITWPKIYDSENLVFSSDEDHLSWCKSQACIKRSQERLGQ